MVVRVANANDHFVRSLNGVIAGDRKRIEQLFDENKRLKRDLQQVKLELKLERQNKFATNPQKQEATDAKEASSGAPEAEETKKKRGAPVGHPGWFRSIPTEYDWAIEVPAPCRCPRCQGHVSPVASLDAVDHLQEDIAKKLGSSDGPVHADKTYWTLDGNRSYYWVHGDEKFIHFQFDTSRAGEMSRDILGDDFTGTLVTDCSDTRGEWLVFLDDPRVPPTNNLAERALRPLVVLRKITFGHRSRAGAQRMAKTCPSAKRPAVTATGPVTSSSSFIPAPPTAYCAICTRVCKKQSCEHRSCLPSSESLGTRRLGTLFDDTGRKRGRSQKCSARYLLLVQTS